MVNPLRSRAARLACGAVLAAALLPIAAAPAGADGQVNWNLPDHLAHKVTVPAMARHLLELQLIASRTGGTRAPSTPGLNQSADYVTHELERAGFDVTTQEFPIRYSQALRERLVVGGTQVEMHFMLYTPDTPVGGVTGPLAVLPSKNGCAATEFAGADYHGTIVLMQRGGCPFNIKQANAAAAGAAGAVIYNNVDGWLRGSLGTETAGVIPTGGISKADGLALSARNGVSTTLELKTLNEWRTSKTVLAQTKTGRTDNVVMAGAHLDSVVEGPGINANGTGAAALLETAIQLGGRPKINNAVRFTFWGGWEFGIISSPYYLSHLSSEELHQIGMYLNFDTLASRNGARFVLDGATGPAGSASITTALTGYLDRRGAASDKIAINAPRSDQLEFLTKGIPSGGLYTGQNEYKTQAQADKFGGTAGAPFDACYHEACDNIFNINWAVLGDNAAAVAWAVGTYALSTEGVNGVAPRPHNGTTHATAQLTE